MIEIGFTDMRGDEEVALFEGLDRFNAVI